MSAEQVVVCVSAGNADTLAGALVSLWPTGEVQQVRAEDYRVRFLADDEIASQVIDYAVARGHADRPLWRDEVPVVRERGETDDVDPAVLGTLLATASRAQLADAVRRLATEATVWHLRFNMATSDDVAAYDRGMVGASTYLGTKQGLDYVMRCIRSEVRLVLTQTKPEPEQGELDLTEGKQDR